tara:strand:- start:204 stop:509 length:306 start_codon:yes stop_codon:yes gene_type:complete
MSQYTEKIQKTLQAFNYLEDGNQISAIEARRGRITTYYKHGGIKIEVTRDHEYNGENFIQGQVIETPPTDPYYIELNVKYNTHKPFKIVTWWKKLCSMFKS